MIRTRRDGAVDNAVIKEEVSAAGGTQSNMRARAATSGEEAKERTVTLEYLKQWMS